MHAQTGTVGSPEFNGTEARFEITLRFPEATGIKVEDRAAVTAALSSDIADILSEDFANVLIPEARPEIGVRVL